MLEMLEREKQVYASLNPGVKHAERIAAKILSACNPVELATLNPVSLRYIEDQSVGSFHGMPVTIIELGAKLAILSVIPNDINIDVAYARREVLRSLLKAPKREHGCDNCGR
jgi:hypothetical protein